MSDIKAHLLPFSVDLEGHVKAKEYLKIEKENAQYETVIVGRKLIGRATTMSDSTQGYIFEKELLDDRYDDEYDQDNDSSDETMGEENPWKKTNKTIKEFILWKKDTAPSETDPRNNALDSWIDISQAIHEPIPLPTTASTI